MAARRPAEGPQADRPGNVSRSVLVVSGTENGRALLKKLLTGTGFHTVAEAASGGEARRLLLSASFDAVVVNAPLPDEFGHELSLYAAEEGAGVILAVKNELFEEVNARVGGFGVFTVGKPVSRAFFGQVVALLTASQNRIWQYERENGRLRNKLKELRVVCRAKCLLVEYLHLSEEEAHRYLEKQAMDSRTSRRAVAEEIVKTYEI